MTNKSKIRLISLGGLGEIGKNMMVVEIGMTWPLLMLE